jgi:hypothetical protein
MREQLRTEIDTRIGLVIRHLAIVRRMVRGLEEAKKQQTLAPAFRDAVVQTLL